MKNKCCNIGCSREAKWHIIEHGTDRTNPADNYCHSCTEHVDEMLSVSGNVLGPVWFSVYPLDQPASMTQETEFPSTYPQTRDGSLMALLDKHRRDAGLPPITGEQLQAWKDMSANDRDKLGRIKRGAERERYSRQRIAEVVDAEKCGVMVTPEELKGILHRLLNPAENIETYNRGNPGVIEPIRLPDSPDPVEIQMNLVNALPRTVCRNAEAPSNSAEQPVGRKPMRT